MVTPRRLGFICQWFPPEPVNVPLWIPQELTELGWKVSVLSGVPNYPTGMVHSGYSPWRPLRERLHGLDVHRAPLYPNHGRSTVRRIANYLSWAASASVVGIRALRRVDVNLVYSSPATAGIPALIAKAMLGKPYALFIQDLWPDSVFSSGFLASGTVAKLAHRGLTWLTQLCYRFADAVVVISPGLIDILKARGVPAEKLHLVYNWADEELFRPVEPDADLRRGLGIDGDDFVVMYAGNHGEAQGLDTFVRAITSLPADLRCHGVLVGSGTQKEDLQRLAEDHPRLHFLDPVPSEQMASVLASADLQLVSLIDDPLFEITMPSKIQTCLASACPVLVCAPGDAARVATESGAGFAVKPGDEGALRNTLIEIAAMPRASLARMGRTGRYWYQKTMAASIGANKLSEILSAAGRKHR